MVASARGAIGTRRGVSPARWSRWPRRRAATASRSISAMAAGWRRRCPHAQVKANEVLWIGDSWILVPGSQHTRRQGPRAGGRRDRAERRLRHRRRGRLHLRHDREPVRHARGGRDQGQGRHHGRRHLGHDHRDVNGRRRERRERRREHLQSVPRAGRQRRDRRARRLLPAARTARHPRRRGIAPAPAAGLRAEHRAVPLPRPAAALVRPSRIHGRGFLPDRRRRPVLADAIWAVMQQNCIAQ